MGPVLQRITAYCAASGARESERSIVVAYGGRSRAAIQASPR